MEFAWLEPVSNGLVMMEGNHFELFIPTDLIREYSNYEVHSHSL